MQNHFVRTLKSRDRLASKLLDVFIVLNFGFLALDVFIAHAVNAFAHPAEWIPIYFACGATGVLALSLFKKQTLWQQRCRLTTAWFAIGVGIAGMLYHLNSQFFADVTLKNLVYTAPFVAPLAFTGLGLLLMMNGMISDGDEQWGQWVVFLAGCGWCGNFILSVFDHAQNGFFYPLEWLPVFTSALAVGCWAVLLLVSYSPGFLTFSVVIFAINFIVGVAGFGFHLAADFNRPVVDPIDGFLYGAPAFAPLLFPNLALLMCLGISKLSVATSKNPQNRL